MSFNIGLSLCGATEVEAPVSMWRASSRAVRSRASEAICTSVMMSRASSTVRATSTPPQSNCALRWAVKVRQRPYFHSSEANCS